MSPAHGIPSEFYNGGGVLRNQNEAQTRESKVWCGIQTKRQKDSRIVNNSAMYCNLPYLKGSSSVINSHKKTAKLYTSNLTVGGWLMSFQISGGVCVTVTARLVRLWVRVCE